MLAYLLLKNKAACFFLHIQIHGLPSFLKHL